MSAFGMGAGFAMERIPPIKAFGCSLYIEWTYVKTCWAMRGIALASMAWVESRELFFPLIDSSVLFSTYYQNS